MTDRLALPPRTPPPDPPAFPLLGVLAPVVLAVGLFAVLGTTTVLLLAVFSPVLAVAAVVDGRLQRRRRLRREERRHAAALDALERDLAVRLAAAVAAAHADAPSPAALAAEPAAWAGRPPSGRLVLGTADLAAPPLVAGTATDERERALLARGAVLPDAPLAVPAATTIAVAGPAPLAAAFARAVAVARLRGAGGGEGARLLATTDGAGADLVVALGPDGGGRVVHASGAVADLAGRAFRPALLTAAAHAAATRRGGAVPLATLLAEPAAGGLAARFLVGPDGPLDVDLVADGPHAVVGGTTGSGKSALLTAWVLALAAAHPPEELLLLLVDCKGGAAFDPLLPLPHVAGVVTDLDAEEAERAVASLGAELLRRERRLRAAGTADVDTAGMPRLVVVVDEYRALVERAPALAALFSDLAARGRSLGVHLVLCTQRPAGAVREEVLANAAIRISLRVHDPADSRAVVGTDAAARLAREEVGAAVLLTDRSRRVRVAAVSAAATADAVAAVAARHPGAVVVAPWLPPLPEDLPLAAVARPPAPLVPLGLADLPDEQRRPVLAWDPVASPRLLVVGGPGTGRSTALAVAARGLGAVPVAPTPAALWDAVHDDGAPLVVDDLDHRLDRLAEPHRAALVDRLLERLRDPAAAPTAVAVRGPSAWSGLPLRGLVGLFDETVLLGLPLDDHLALGGERARWSPRPVPGRGWCGGRRVQLARAPLVPPAPAPAIDPLPAGPVLVVTDRPGERGRRLAAAGRRVLAPESAEAGEDVAVVGSPEAWQRRWQAVAEWRATRAVVADRVAPADLRTLLGVATPLPPVDGPDDAVLLLPEQPPRRVRL